MRSVLVTLLVAACAHAPATTTTPDPPAIQDAERAVAKEPSSAEARDALGEALLLHGALDRAERAFAEALRIAPDFATAHHGLAVIHFHRGDPAGGVVALRAGIALTPAIDPTYARTRLVEGLAWAHALEGAAADADRAIVLSVEAQGLEPALASRVVHVGRARLLLQARRWSDVLVETAAAQAPGAPPFVAVGARTVEVRAHAGAGDLARAESTLALLAADPAAARHPGLVEAKLTFAIAQGELDAAAALVATLDELDPYAAEEASLALARALVRAGRTADARARLAVLSTRYLRSVPSAYTRRAAAAELATLPHE